MPSTDIERQSFGEGGAVYESGTGSLIRGPFCALLIVEDTKFHTLTMTDLTGDVAASGGIDHTGGSADTMPAGVTIYGQINDFKLTSGKVLAYHAA